MDQRELFSHIQTRSMQSASETSFEPIGTPTMSPTEASEELVTGNDTEIIRETLRVYGGLYAGIFLLFCIARHCYPKLYNIRSWVPEMKCDLACSQKYGFFSWAWKVFQVDDDTLLENIGMDALCFLRCLRFGAKLSLCGLFNSVWLIPMFLTARDSPETTYLEDLFARMSVSNLPSESPRFAGVVLGAYIIVLSSLYLLTQEYNWYIEYRHKFLSQRIPRNYAIYVSGIPEHLRSNYALADFFRNSSWNSAVVEAHMAMDIPSLEAKVARRETVLDKLEHAMAEEKLKGVVKTHRQFNIKNTIAEKSVTITLQTVETLQAELSELNQEISLAIGGITNQNHRMRRFMSKERADSNVLRGRALSADQPTTPTEMTMSGLAFSDVSSVQSDIELQMSHDERLESELSEAEIDDNHIGASLREVQEEYEEYVSGAEARSTKSDTKSDTSDIHPFLELFGLDNFMSSPRTNEVKNTSDIQSAPQNTEPDVECDIQDHPTNKANAGDLGTTNSTHRDGAISETQPDTELPSQDVCISEAIEAFEVADGKSESRQLTKEGMSITESPQRTAKNVSKKSVQSKESSRSGRSVESSLGSTFFQVSDGVKRVRDISVGAAKKAADFSTKGAKKAADIGIVSAKKAADLGMVSAKKAADLGFVGAKKAADLGFVGAKKAADLSKQGAKKAAEFSIQKIQQAPELASKLTDTAAAIAPILRSKEDGAPRNAGFVVFRDLYTTHAARQMLHHPSGDTMLIEQAPTPEEIFWRNIGLPSEARKTGALLSVAATATLCFFWSIPVAFLSSLTEVKSLKETLPFLERWVEAAPAIENMLALIAPLLLLILTEVVLPPILYWFATWEGLIASPQLEASTFVKLSTFVLIQTFFVSTISGSISAEIANIIDNPEEVINLLANSLPAQSSYFIQIVLVFTFLLHGIELLRLYPLLLALLRRFIGPNLTAKERSKTWRFLNSLEDPPEFCHAEVFAQMVLFYVIFFVYSSIAPLACLFLCTCFFICECGYRYHFIHNHKTSPDSGGKIWKGFINVFFASMLIGELTLIGLLVLKKAVYAVPALSPLPAITILYMMIVSPKKTRASDNLATIQCVALDRQYQEESIQFLRGQYVQPALKHRRLFPDPIEEDIADKSENMKR